MYNVITVIKDCLGFVVNYINVNAVLLTCSHQNSLVDTSVTWKMNWMKPLHDRGLQGFNFIQSPLKGGLTLEVNPTLVWDHIIPYPD